MRLLFKEHKIFTHGLQSLFLRLEVLVCLLQILLGGLQVLFQLKSPLLQVPDVFKDLENKEILIVRNST
jgi:hypothetical protein